MINSKPKIFLRRSETGLNPLTLHGAGNHMTKMALSNIFQSDNELGRALAAGEFEEERGLSL